MLSFHAGLKIYLYSEPTDMRKSFNGLSSMVKHALGRNVLDGSLFLFFNKNRNRLKVLFWHEGGFCLFCKRLEKGRFRFPEKAQIGTGEVALDDVELHLILSGFDPSFRKKLPRYTP